MENLANLDKKLTFKEKRSLKKKQFNLNKKLKAILEPNSETAIKLKEKEKQKHINKKQKLEEEKKEILSKLRWENIPEEIISIEEKKIIINKKIHQEKLELRKFIKILILKKKKKIYSLNIRFLLTII